MARPLAEILLDIHQTALKTVRRDMYTVDKAEDEFGNERYFVCSPEGDWVGEAHSTEGQARLAASNLNAAVKGDGLEVRRYDGPVERWGIYDTLTGKFTSVSGMHRYRVQERLDYVRCQKRPIIVRWVFGLRINQSRELGVPE